MRKLMLAALACAALSACEPAMAQGIKLTVNTNEPITGLSPDDWATLMTRSINAAPIIGKESAYVVNATPETIQAVKCDRWYLVGTAASWGTDSTASPVNLPPWSVTLVPAKGFDGYCEKGVVGIGSMSNYAGKLNAANGKFSDTTFITFKPNAR